MGSSESKEASSITEQQQLPPFTSFETIQNITSSLKQDQSLLIHAQDIDAAAKRRLKSKSDNKNNKDIFDFWFCTVDKITRTITSTKNDNNDSNNSSDVDDVKLFCTGNTQGNNKDNGDLMFWMKKDFNSKYRTRPAVKDEVDLYLQQTHTLVDEVAQATIKSKLEDMDKIERAGASFMTWSAIPRSLIWTNDWPEKWSKSKNSSSSSSSVPLLDSGLFVFNTKDEEKRFGIHAMGCLLRASNKDRISEERRGLM